MRDVVDTTAFDSYLVLTSFCVWVYMYIKKSYKIQIKYRLYRKNMNILTFNNRNIFDPCTVSIY